MSSAPHASAPAAPRPAPTPPPPPSKLSAATKVGLLAVPCVILPAIEIGAMVKAGEMSGTIALAMLGLIGVLASAICLAIAFNVPIDKWKERSVQIIIGIFVVIQIAVVLWVIWKIGGDNFKKMGLTESGINPLDQLQTFVNEKVWNFPDAVQCLSDRGGFFRIVFAVFATVMPIYAFFTMFKPLVVVPAMIIFRGVDDKGVEYSAAGRLWAPLSKGGMGAILFGLLALLFIYILPKQEMCMAEAAAISITIVVAPPAVEEATIQQRDHGSRSGSTKPDKKDLHELKCSLPGAKKQYASCRQ